MRWHESRRPRCYTTLPSRAATTTLFAALLLLLTTTPAAGLSVSALSARIIFDIETSAAISQTASGVALTNAAPVSPVDVQLLADSPSALFDTVSLADIVNVSGGFTFLRDLIASAWVEECGPVATFEFAWCADWHTIEPGRFDVLTALLRTARQ